MSQYSEVVKKLPSAADEADRMPCRWCKTPTLRATLNQYGARCLSCCEDFCALGAKGGVDGHSQGAPDTEQQAAMRRRVRSALDRAKDGQAVPLHEITSALQASGDLLPMRRIPLPGAEEPAWVREEIGR